MSPNPFQVPAKPAHITLDTLPQLFAHHRAVFGGWSMTQTPPETDPPGQPGQPGQPGIQPPAAGDTPPERPGDIAEEEWNALADPGKRAIVRERARAEAAERALAASRARPAAPKPGTTPPADQGAAGAQQPGQPGATPDIATMIQQAVAAAVKPLVDRDEQREAVRAAEKVQEAVIEAAKPRLHDATDALAGIDLTTVIDDQGRADTAKIKTALDDLVTRKPHLAKAAERHAPPGIGGGGGPAGLPEAEKVKAVLADMQRATGVRIPSASNTSN